MSARFGVEADAAYRWAAAAVADRSVLAVDADGEQGARLLSEAGARSVLVVAPEAPALGDRERGEEPSVELRTAEGDAVELPDSGFEVVTCFGPLEHAPDPDSILAELDRVLADDGLLLLSLPIGEGGGDYGSDKPLKAAVAASERTLDHWRPVLSQRFRNVAYGQRRICIAAVVLGEEQDVEAPIALEGAIWRRGEPGEDTVALALASDAELPELPALASLAGWEELNALAERLGHWEQRARRAEAEGSAKHWELVAAREGQRRLRKRLHTLEHRPFRILSRVIRRRPARLGEGPPPRKAELEPEQWD